MVERPFQDSVDDEVGIASDGRSEMRVFVKAQREMAERFGGIASLLERTEHQVGDDALFGFAYDLSNEPLVMLRRDVQFRAGERDLHTPLAAVAVGIGASDSCRR